MTMLGKIVGGLQAEIARFTKGRGRLNIETTLSNAMRYYDRIGVDYRLYASHQNVWVEVFDMAQSGGVFLCQVSNNHYLELPKETLCCVVFNEPAN